MPEKCPICGNEFANSKALGSHVYYMHKTKDSASTETKQRPESDKKRFEVLLNDCLTNNGLPTPPAVEKIEQAITEIPKGVSPALDRYRNAFSCALNKERLLKEAEELIREVEDKKPK